MNFFVLVQDFYDGEGCPVIEFIGVFDTMKKAMEIVTLRSTSVLRLNDRAVRFDAVDCIDKGILFHQNNEH